MHKLKVHLTVVLGDLLVSGLGALVALLALFSLHIPVLLDVDLLAVLLRYVATLLPGHLLARLLVVGHTLLLRNLDAVLHFSAALLGHIFAALGVGCLALFPGH